jgi:hypothetical protein
LLPPSYWILWEQYYAEKKVRPASAVTVIVIAETVRHGPKADMNRMIVSFKFCCDD